MSEGEKTNFLKMQNTTIINRKIYLKNVKSSKNSKVLEKITSYFL